MRVYLPRMSWALSGKRKIRGGGICFGNTQCFATPNPTWARKISRSETEMTRKCKSRVNGEREQGNLERVIVDGEGSVELDMTH